MNATRSSNGSIPPEFTQSKRLRTGSISGRLRTASDLEDYGFIDKEQKGLIKDLIISGDTKIQGILDDFEQGKTADLEELLRKTVFSRKQSIDLLDGLDFDFLNSLQTDDESALLLDDLAFEDFGDGLRKGSFAGPGTSCDTSHDFLSAQRSFIPAEFESFPDTAMLHGKQRIAERSSSIHSLSQVDCSETEKLLYKNGDIDLAAYGALAQALQQAPELSGTAPLSGRNVTSSGFTTANHKASGKTEKGSIVKLPRKADRISRETASSSSSVTNARNSAASATSAGNRSTKSAADLNPIKGADSNSSLGSSSTNVNGDADKTGYIGAYSVEQRKIRLQKFFEKRNRRVWTKKVKYDVRKNFADSRLRIKGRFVKKEDEDIMRELLDI